MQVLIISQYYPPDMGGGATRAQNVAKGLVMNGCKVTVVAASPHYPTGNIPKRYRWRPMKVDHENGIRIIRTFVPPLSSKGISRRFILFFSFVLSSLFSLFLVGRVDVVWAANPNIMSVFPSFIYSKVKSCPLVQNVDDLWPEALYDLGLPKNSLFAKTSEVIASLAYSLVDAITPISPGYCKVLIEKYHLSATKLEVIRAGVDASRFVKIHEMTRDNQKKTILYIGALSPAYDFEQVFEAAHLLSDLHNVQFVLQGGGELGPSLKSKLASSNLHNMKIIEEIVDRQRVAELLINADILILPLRRLPFIELGISSKLYEYQAAGKPIICCSSGFPAKYVIDSNSGIVVAPGDSARLAESIVLLSTHPDLANKFGSNGRDYVLRELDVDKIGFKMKHIFHRLIAQDNKDER